MQLYSDLLMSEPHVIPGLFHWASIEVADEKRQIHKGLKNKSSWGEELCIYVCTFSPENDNVYFLRGESDSLSPL